MASKARKSNGVPATGVERAGRDQRRVDRRVAVGVQPQLVVLDRPGALAGQVEVGVVGQVDVGRLVGRGGVVHLQPVAVVERVDHGHRQRAGEAALAVGARAGQPHARRSSSVLTGCRRPDDLVEALEPAVQRVRAVVGVERVGDAVERELRAADAVAVAADDRAEVRVGLRVGLARVAGDGVEAERDVGLAPAPVGHDELLDDAAVGEDRHRHAARVAQRVAVDRRPAHRGRQRAEARLGDAEATGPASGRRRTRSAPRS